MPASAKEDPDHRLSHWRCDPEGGYGHRGINGGVIVCLDDCSGERTRSMMIDENADDILRAISDRYLSIHCSVMTPNDDRLEKYKENDREI